MSQATVVQRLGVAIHYINHHPVDNIIISAILKPKNRLSSTEWFIHCIVLPTLWTDMCELEQNKKKRWYYVAIRQMMIPLENNN